MNGHAVQVIVYAHLNTGSQVSLFCWNQLSHWRLPFWVMRDGTQIWERCCSLSFRSAMQAFFLSDSSCRAGRDPPFTAQEYMMRSKYRSTLAFDVAVALAFDVPPRCLRRASQSAAIWARACIRARQGRMPKLSHAGQGWPVCETRRGLEAQGTHVIAQQWRGRRLRGRFFWFLFLSIQEKGPAIYGGTKRFGAGAVSREARAVVSRVPSYQYTSDRRDF